MTMDQKTNFKIRTSEKAAQLYLKNERFKIQQLAEELETEPGKIFESFPNRNAILDYYYESRLLLLDDITQKIEGFHTFTLSEKLSTVILTILDLFQEHREFVLETYRSRVACSSNDRTGFNTGIKERVSEIFKSDSGVSTFSGMVFQSLFISLFTLHFHAIVRVWMNDKSDSMGTTMALVEKWTSLVQEIFYSAVIDKGFDLAKFIFNSSGFSDWVQSENKNYQTGENKTV